MPATEKQAPSGSVTPQLEGASASFPHPRREGSASAPPAGEIRPEELDHE